MFGVGLEITASPPLRIRLRDLSRGFSRSSASVFRDSVVTIFRGVSRETTPIFSLISITSVVILHDMYLRTIKVRSSSGSINEYVRLVEAYRNHGKVKQRTLADLGRKDLLAEILPKLQRFLGGDRADTGEAEDPDILDASTWGPVLAVRRLFDQLGLWTILDAASVRPRVCRSPTGRSVLVANRLIRPASEHRLAGWLET